jgi:hypothetical protein
LTPEMKFVLHGIGKERLTVTYQTVKDYIIQRTGPKDIQKQKRCSCGSLRNMEKINMSKHMLKRKILQETKTDDKATKQEGFDILYSKAEIDMYPKRKHQFEDSNMDDQNILSDLPTTH